MYRIRLQDFEGPLDLLLFFIRRDELDIYDIPIAQITEEYLSFVKVMEEVDLDGVGEFVYMAAMLISIKARLLLPTQELDEEGEPIDPRQELVERLLEYMRFKEASDQLSVAHECRSDLFTRGNASAEQGRFVEDSAETLTNTSIYHLVRALGRILADVPEPSVHAVERVEYTVDAQQVFVTEILLLQPQYSFREIVHDKPKGFIIATFLAVLELARLGEVWLAAADTTDDFYVARSLREGAASGKNSTNGRHNGT